MKRGDLEHLLRAAGTILGTDRIIVVGSQAILALAASRNREGGSRRSLSPYSPRPTGLATNIGEGRGQPRVMAKRRGRPLAPKPSRSEDRGLVDNALGRVVRQRAEVLVRNVGVEVPPTSSPS